MASRTFVPFLPLLCILVIIPVTRAALDLCHSDPRVETQHPQCHPTRHILHVPNLHRNPNHSLHEWLWAIAHYLLHCRTSDLTLTVNHPPLNLTLCDQPSLSVSSRFRPTWGICVARLLARHARVNFILNDSSHLQKSAPSELTNEFTNTSLSCVHRTWLGVLPPHFGIDGFDVPIAHFGSLSWFFRECGRNTTCVGSGLVPIPDALRRRALRFLADSVRTYFKLQSRNKDPRVRILLYDRSDSLIRQWVNMHETHAYLKKDKRLIVRVVHHTPMSLADQVRLYDWADIVIAPTGGAMANSIFMQRGAEILEIVSHCEKDIARDRYRVRPPTGLHAWLLDLNIMYLECHDADENETLAMLTMSGVKMRSTHWLQVVSVKTVLEALKPALERQVVRLQTLSVRPKRDIWKSSTVGALINSVITDVRVKWAARSGAIMMGPFVMMVLMFRSLRGLRKTSRSVESRSGAST